MTYRVEVTDQARDDADAVYAWIAENASPEQAERWYQGLFTQIETLIKQPLRCPLAAENPRFPGELRELLYGKRHGKFRIIFTIRETTVAILRIRRGSQDAIEP